MTSARRFGCLECPRKFGSVVAMRFHMRAEHPGAYGVKLPMIRDLEREDRRDKSVAEREDTLGKIHPALEALYHNCACKRPYSAHLRVRRELDGLARSPPPPIIQEGIA